jgi:hypothetical protein
MLIFATLKKSVRHKSHISHWLNDQLTFLTLMTNLTTYAGRTTERYFRIWRKSYC